MKNEMIIENEKNKSFVFISYSHKDSEIVLQVIKELQNNSYRIWYDDGIDPGTEWDKNIAEHVENCGYFIAFISKNYISSSNCKDELNFARDLEKKRFLVYIEEVELPSEMKMRLSRIQNIHKYKYENDSDFYNKFFSADGLSEFKSVKIELEDEKTDSSKKSKSLFESYDGRIILDNRYELRNIIGKGGFGVTYKAKDLKNNKMVAVKVGSYVLSDSGIRLHKHLMNIDNDNLCKIYAASSNEEGELYIVSELLNDSKSLFEVKDYREMYDNIDDNYPFGAHIFVLIDILNGLKCLHDNNIVHADINPTNIMTNGYTTKVIDYSSAFFVDEGPTSEGEHTVIIGGYNSPEEKKDFRSDIYSVGMIGFKWLTGEIPKEDKDGRLVFDDIDLDETVLRVLTKATAFNPEDRIQTADEFINEIKECFFAFEDQSHQLLNNEKYEECIGMFTGHLALSLDDVLITKNYKQQFSNPITLRMPNNESLEFEFIEESTLDEKYIIVSRRKSKDCFVFAVFKNPEGTANPPVAIFDGKKRKKIYRAFMEAHKYEYEFTDEIAMQPNIQPRKSEQPRVFTEKTAQGMFGPYLKDVIEIPCKYTLIDSYVFKYASTSYLPKKISKLIIPDSVTKIEAFAFSDIIVNEIEVSNNVTEIGVGAFNLSADGFIVCTPDSYAYKYAKYHDLKNSVDIANDYKIKGVCAYCGGRFSGLFKKKCSLCGKEKDY